MAAPLDSTIFLVIELAIGMVLILGWVAVRRGYVRAHRYLQSSMVLVNIPVVLIWMAPRYLSLGHPATTADLGQAYYLFPALMLAAGALAELLGVYIVLVAGTRLVPERFRFKNYKPWMRSELALWWLVLAFGAATYYYWYLRV